jgi:hypothetical protein
VAVVVAEVEGRRLDHEAVDALDEPAPIGAAAELAVVRDLEPDILLQFDRIADAAILDFGKARIVDLSRQMIAKRLAQLGRPQQAADVIGAKRRAAIRTQAHGILICSLARRRSRRARASAGSSCCSSARSCGHAARPAASRARLA